VSPKYTTVALQLEEVPMTLQLLEVPTVSVTLQLEIPTISRYSGPTLRVESTIKAARIHYLEVPMALAALQLQVPTASVT
jgi:hypothetical protein